MRQTTAKAPKVPDISQRLALTVTETARLLGISGASVRGLIRAGRLRGIAFGAGEESKSFIVSVESLKAFLAGEGGKG